MYQKKDDLWSLLQSFTSSENASFMQHYGPIDENKPLEELPYYLQIFAIHSNAKSEPIAFPNYGKQVLTKAKRRLYHHALKHLRQQNDELSPDIIIHNQLTDVEVLYGRHLAAQGFLILKKAYQLARETERFGLQLQALEWERRLNVVLDDLGRAQSDIARDERYVLDQVRQCMEMEAILATAKSLKKQHGYLKGDMVGVLRSQTIEAPTMSRLEECRSQRAIHYYHYIHSLYYWMLSEPRKAHDHSRKLISNPASIILPGDYVDGLLEHVTSCVCLGNFEGALAGIEIAQNYTAEKMLDQSTAFSIRIFYYRCCYHTVIYYFTGDLEKLEQTVTYVEQGLIRFGSSLSDESKQVLTANLMNAYVCLGNTKRVNELYNQLANRRSKKVRSDIYDDLYLFRLFELMDNGQYGQLRPSALSACRYYKTFADHEQRFALELAIVRPLMKIQEWDKEKARSQLLKTIRKQLESHIRTYKVAGTFQEHYSFYLIWIQRLTTSKTFAQCAQEWYVTFRTANEKKKERTV